MRLRWGWVSPGRREQEACGGAGGTPPPGASPKSNRGDQSPAENSETTRPGDGVRRVSDGASELPGAALARGPHDARAPALRPSAWIPWLRLGFRRGARPARRLAGRLVDALRVRLLELQPASLRAPDELDRSGRAFPAFDGPVVAPRLVVPERLLPAVGALPDEALVVASEREVSERLVLARRPHPITSSLESPSSYLAEISTCGSPPG